MVNDTIADTLTRIRNGVLAKHQIVQVPYSNIVKDLLKVLKTEGFVEDFVTTKDNFRSFLLISLKYKGKTKIPIIKSLRRISKPGLRVYTKHKDLPKVLGGIGIAIISTSRGIMTDKQARHKGIGGEILCYVW